MIFARTESLIAGAGMNEALARASCYLHSDADGIVVHSKDRTAAEVFRFLQGYRELQERSGGTKPLVVIPTAYNSRTDTELFEAGASIVIHGNQQIRAACKAMQAAVSSILLHDRSQEADEICAPVAELLKMIGAHIYMCISVGCAMRGHTSA